MYAMPQLKRKSRIGKAEIQLSRFGKAFWTVSKLLIEITGHSVRLVIYYTEALVGYVKLSESVKLIHHIGGVKELFFIVGRHWCDLF